jgi:hypothetical protein
LRAEEPERHVDSGGDPGSGDEVSVLHVADAREDVGAAGAKLLDEVEVRGDLPAARDPRLVQEQRAGADAGDEPAARRDLAQPGEHSLVVRLPPRAHAPRDEDQIERRRVGPRRIGKDAHPLRAANGPGLLRDEQGLDLLRAGRIAPLDHHPRRPEDLPRADEIELFRVVEDDDADGRHGSSFISSPAPGAAPR